MFGDIRQFMWFLGNAVINLFMLDFHEVKQSLKWAKFFLTVPYDSKETIKQPLPERIKNMSIEFLGFTAFSLTVLLLFLILSYLADITCYIVIENVCK